MGSRKCESAEETARWIGEIAEFLKGVGQLREGHLVNFFKDRLWESLDPEWVQCLRAEPVERLVRIPSGLVGDHWPASLVRFLRTLTSLTLPRRPEHEDEQELSSALATGMSPKKKHEVGVASALVNSVAHSVHARTILDVGAGQGYLSQALCFHYNHNVVAIDASPHHSSVTLQRARRITRHHASNSDSPSNLPKTLTCRVLSAHMLEQLARQQQSPLLLAGLHACGDLSVMMLKTFSDCQHVQAVVSVGCCYNLLSEHHGFPLSRLLKSTGMSLGKSLLDLACQSAERWKCLETDAAINNFDLHAFRAAFQMVLDKFYPQVMIANPSIGRQGKALRRLQKRELQTASLDKCSLFTTYCQSGLRRLGLQPLQDTEFHMIWKEVEPYLDLVGPYWSLRAALGPLLETFILLDRLLFLKEQGDSIEAVMLPIFDPEMSPRNVAIVAKKIDSNVK